MSVKPLIFVVRLKEEFDISTFMVVSITGVRTASDSGMCLVHVMRFDWFLIKFVFVLFCVLIVCATSSWDLHCSRRKTLLHRSHFQCNLSINSKYNVADWLHWTDCSAGRIWSQPLCHRKTKINPTKHSQGKCHVRIVQNEKPFTNDEFIASNYFVFYQIWIIKKIQCAF